MKSLLKPATLKGTFFLVLAAALSLPGSTLFAQTKPVANAKQIIISEGDEEGERPDRAANCGGVERWGQKVLVDTATNSINWTPDTISVSKFDSLITYPPNSNAPRTAPIEFRTFAIHCRVVAKRDETDSDYHLQMYDGVLNGIAEIPDPSCAGAATSAWVNNFIEARNFADKYMGVGTNYSVSIGRVIITGVAFVDPPHGQTGVAQNNLELHPVTNLVFENPSDGVKELYNTLDVSMGPNPFSVSTEFQLNSKLHNLNNVTLTLFDMLGQELVTHNIPVIGNSQIDYILEKNDLKPGIYFYRFRNNGPILYEGRFIVE